MATRVPSVNDVAGVPPEFRDAVTQMHAARLRPELLCEEMPAPQRIAPYSSALAADVLREMGFPKVAHLAVGFNGWAEAGRAVEREPDERK